MGEDFLSKDKKITKQEYDVQKEQLKKVAKKHQGILKEIKEGKRKTKTAMDVKGK